MSEGNGDQRPVEDTESEKDRLRKDMEAALSGGHGPKTVRFALACLGGVIPFAGGAVGGMAGIWSEEEQARINKLFAAWLKLQEQELKEIAATLFEVMARLDLSDPEVEKRAESQEYLSIVRKCFRDWSAAESEDKRILIRNLLVNAASCRLASDDIVKLFIQWIDDYSEAHFKVIKAVYNHAGSTRHDIWLRIHGERVREDSADADLFKLLIRDLSTGQVIRQHREKDWQGNLLKHTSKRPTAHRGRAMISAFEDDKGYELTELGKQFVHYTMNEIVPRIQQTETGQATQTQETPS